MAGADDDIWSGRRVLITGHTGFKGSWLALWLAARGAVITGIALDPPTRPGLFELARVSDTLEADLRVDLREPAALRSAVAAAAPEVVFHFAAQPLVTSGYDAPVDTFATNVMGTAHLIAGAAAMACVRAILVVTTDKVYDNREWVHPYREPDPLGGRDPHAASKACAEILTAAFRASLETGAKIATARAGNVIAGGDFARNRLVPDCIRAFAAGEPVVLRMPDAVRPWQHVLDPLSGYITLAERLYRGDDAVAEAWNFGPDTGGERPVHVVAERLAALWGEGANVTVSAEEPRHHEAGVLRLDSTKARLKLGWQPAWPLDTALERTCAWYRAWHEEKDLAAFTREEIARYEADSAR